MNELGVLLFITGCAIGSIAGVVALSLCVIAKRSNERAERMLDRRHR